MRLIARESGDVIRVEQCGGFSPENRVLLRSVSQNYQCKAGIYWIYPKTAGTLMSLVEAAEFAGAELDLDDVLQDQLDASREATQRERELRKMIQPYIDDPKRQLPGYISRTDPIPWHHQQVAYHWGMRADSLYLAHKPGLGKTRSGADLIRGRIQAGTIRFPQQEWVAGHPNPLYPDSADKYMHAHWATVGGCLIVCPGIVLGTWQEQLAQWQGIEAVVVNTYSRQGKLYRAGVKAWVHVITYDSLEIVQDNRYDYIVFDEAHYLANDDTVRFGYARHLRQHAGGVLALSGTPISNQLPSLWSQFYLLDGGRTLGTSYESYRRRYFDMEGRKLIPKPSAEDNIAKQISRIAYFLTMQEAFPDKPRKISRVVKIPMTQEQVRYYRKVRDQVATQILTGHVSAPEINQKMMKLMQICQGFVIDDEKQVYEFTSAKLHAFRQMVIEPNGESYYGHTRTVVWVALKRDLAKLTAELEAAGVPWLCLHGGITKKSDRDQIRHLWNNDYRYRVFVGMIQIGIGINLHAPTCVDAAGNPARCSNTIYYGWTWRMTHLEQSMDRVYRGDQVETCLYTFLVSADLDGSGETKPMDAKSYINLQEKLEQSKYVSEESMDYVRGLLED